MSGFPNLDTNEIPVVELAPGQGFEEVFLYRKRRAGPLAIAAAVDVTFIIGSAVDLTLDLSHNQDLHFLELGFLGTVAVIGLAATGAIARQSRRASPDTTQASH